jgi:choline dehydrogenase-like flavoprotein
MLDDARQVPDEATLGADVCIVGAGAAGITLALELAGTGLSVVLVESGGLNEERASRRLNAGETDGLPYGPLEALRVRALGGSTHRWGGWSRPLAREDVEPRPWVRNSGWPIPYEDVTAFYERASELLRLGPLDYDTAAVERIPNPRVRLIPLQGSRVASFLIRFSPPARFGTMYVESLRRAENVRCLLHANAVELVTDAGGGRVERVRIATLQGKRFEVAPRVAVLAAGGIENARLLLLSTRVSPSGIGNEHDLVGRYFMEHPVLDMGRLLREPGAPPLDLYDTTFSYHNPAIAVDGVAVTAYLAATPQVERHEQLLRHRVLFRTAYRGEEAAGTEALKRLMGRSRLPVLRQRRLWDVARVARHAPRVATAVVGRRLKVRRLERVVAVLTIVEPEPIPESRVTLGTTRCALGLPRACVTWRLSERVTHTFRRATAIVGEELARAGIGTIEPIPEDGAQRSPMWCWHHIGTTRMSSEENQGVVDPNCRVHSISNLYVAGSSVFPTAGCDMPTLTIVALAVRLAAHIRGRLENHLVA